MKFTRGLFCLFSAIGLSLPAFAGVGEKILFPSADDKFKIEFRASDNGSDTSAFKYSVSKDSINVQFSDKDKQDNYLHIDMGRYDLTPYMPGGYLLIDLELDNPVIRLSASIADKSSFWPTRQFLEGEFKAKQGRYIYKYYLDMPRIARLKENKDNLFIFIHDFGGTAKGEASIKIRKVALMPQTANWEEEKVAKYKDQYEWRNHEDLGKYYRSEYSNLFRWDAISSNPFMKRISLDGDWQKAFAGELTWNTEALADKNWLSTAGLKWEKVSVPEQAVEDQQGGYYYYKKTFKLDLEKNSAVYLRFEDIADYAKIYINGEEVSCQTSTRRRHDWIVEGGSRRGENIGKTTKEVMTWQAFERCQIPFPFDVKAIPDDAKTILLPIYSGVYKWPEATDISRFVKDGENTVALKLYGCPMRGFWIFKNGEDRTFKNVYGILGSASLLIDEKPLFSSIERKIKGGVDASGNAAHAFTVSLNERLASKAERIVLNCAGQEVAMSKTGKDIYSGVISIPAGFAKYTAIAAAFDDDGNMIAERELVFNSAVQEIRDAKLYLNGEPFFVRGINAALGIEWNNDRKITRREWLKQLRFYQQLGFNSLRLEGCNQQHVEDALEAGMTVMPVYVPASCESTTLALGNPINPDYEFNTDAHKEMTIFLSEYPNVMFWNFGNENHHSAGYNDRFTMNRFCEVAEAAIHRFDPYKRPCVFANLDTYGANWFFAKGQDVIGFNTYSDYEKSRREWKELFEETGKPFVFTEWGFHDNEARALKDRAANTSDWEKRFREKWELIKITKGSVGGYLYAYHGELNDERGRAFLQDVMSPFNMQREDNLVKFENKDLCNMEKLSILLLSDSNIVISQYDGMLKPGQSIRIAVPKEQTDISSWRIEIRYETHKGLKHFFSRMFQNIKK